VEFRVLGPLEVIDGIRPLPLGGPKQRAVLAQLLLHANEVVSGDALVEAVWGGEPPHRARATLHVYIANLRKLLHSVDPVSQPQVRLGRAGSGYRLHVGNDELDLTRFQQLVGEGRAALDRQESLRAAGLLREALALWRGPAFPDLSGWGFPEVAALDEQRLSAFEDCIDAELKIGRGGELVAELEPLVAAHPLRERLHGQLILALYRSGRQADALATYRAMRRTLLEELGVDPGPSLQLLERGILRHDPTLQAPPRQRDSLPPRLLDEFVERLGPAEEGRPGRALMYRPLPEDPTPLIDRRADVRAVTRLFGRGDVRLVTLTGPAGVGKTRLAVAAARRSERAFSDGIVWIPVEHVHDADDLFAAVAMSLGLSQSTGRSMREVVVADLGSRKLLLVIDNFEHLLEFSHLLPEILAAAPGVRALITSRAVLRLRAEKNVRVEPLPVFSGADVRESPAVHLLIAAGSRARPGWRPVPEDLSALGDVARRLDGLPLALELGAAWLRVLTPDELSAALAESGVHLLVSGPRDAQERQRSVQGALDWSFRLLGEAEQRLFCRLSVFVGGATFRTIEDVCSLGHEFDVLSALRTLVEHSLVEAGRGTSPRFRMLEVVRQLAAEKLMASGEREIIEARHTQHFADLAAAALAGMNGPAQLAWLHRVDDEFENILSCTRRDLSRGSAVTLLSNVQLLSSYLWVRERYDEGLELVRWGLADTRTLDNKDEILLRAWLQAFTFFATGDASALADEVPRLVERARAENDDGLIGLVLAGMSILAVVQGSVPDGMSSLTESIARLEAAGHHMFAAMQRAGLARLTLLAGDLPAAITLLRTLASDTRSRGNLIVEAVSTTMLGLALLQQGDLPGARRTFLSAVHLHLRIGRSRAQIGLVLHGLAAVLAAAGQADLAAEAYGLSTTVRPPIGGLAFEHILLDALLPVEIRSGDQYDSQRSAGAECSISEITMRIEQVSDV
jgi:predicted ATPase/DNA-binding SARP family transcriptional activator